MLDKSDSLKFQDGSIQILDEIKAKYHQVNKPIRIKVSEYCDRNVFSTGRHIILNGYEPVKEGTLIQVKFDLKDQFKHSFTNGSYPTRSKKVVGIAQVLKILDIRNKKYKMLIHLLDFMVS